jgi:hypothetical protein
MVTAAEAAETVYVPVTAPLPFAGPAPVMVKVYVPAVDALLLAVTLNCESLTGPPLIPVGAVPPPVPFETESVAPVKPDPLITKVVEEPPATPALPVTDVIWGPTSTPSP